MILWRRIEVRGTGPHREEILAEHSGPLPLPTKCPGNRAGGRYFSMRTLRLQENGTCVRVTQLLSSRGSFAEGSSVPVLVFFSCISLDESKYVEAWRGHFPPPYTHI